MPVTIVKAGQIPFDIFFYELAEELQDIDKKESMSWMRKFFMSGCFCFHFMHKENNEEFKAIYMDKAFCMTLTEQEQFALIQHEAGHITHQDCIKNKPVNGVVTSRQMEIDADTYALKAGAKPLALAKGIYKVTKHGLSTLSKAEAAYVFLVYVLPELTNRFVSIAKFCLKK